MTAEVQVSHAVLVHFNGLWDYAQAQTDPGERSAGERMALHYFDHQVKRLDPEYRETYDREKRETYELLRKAENWGLLPKNEPPTLH